MSGESDYGLGIRSGVRGLWRGLLTWQEANNAIGSTIRRGLRKAWKEGATECGIQWSELSQEELITLSNRIMTELIRLPAFLNAIEAGRKQDPDGNPNLEAQPLAGFLKRAELWALQYRNTREQAKSMACADQKCEWIYGDTVAHCADCSRAVGRVYRLSTWDKYGWVPGSRALACGGWRCKCQRVPTDKPVTPGRPPALSGGG